MQGSFTETRLVWTGSTNSGLDTFDPDSKVLSRIIDSFRTRSTVKKTHVQLASKLRWDLFAKYWEWLQNCEYIKCSEDEEGKSEFTLTPLVMNYLVGFFIITTICVLITSFSN